MISVSLQPFQTLKGFQDFPSECVLNFNGLCTFLNLITRNLEKENDICAYAFGVLAGLAEAPSQFAGKLVQMKTRHVRVKAPLGKGSGTPRALC